MSKSSSFSTSSSSTISFSLYSTVLRRFKAEILPYPGVCFRSAVFNPIEKNIKPYFVISKSIRKLELIHPSPLTNLPSTTMTNARRGIQASIGASSFKKPKEERHALTLEGKTQFIASVQAAKKDEEASIYSVGSMAPSPAGWLPIYGIWDKTLAMVDWTEYFRLKPTLKKGGNFSPLIRKHCIVQEEWYCWGGRSWERRWFGHGLWVSLETKQGEDRFCFPFSRFYHSPRILIAGNKSTKNEFERRKNNLSGPCRCRRRVAPHR